ncbi:hypothetical protein [uncultured Muribaculum sp.]|uniref:hypothetical protein n=1 Tax=uncultured Muribaculum sp. TaxID=1918613 RepID=UPI0027309346|nr:hypothetical protein [uncultured Muribaculum sp.]
MNDKKPTIAVAEQLLFNIYKNIQTPEVVGMLLDIKQASRDGDLKPLLKALRSVRRDITEIINELKQ